jgi:hypothetical protein
VGKRFIVKAVTVHRKLSKDFSKAVPQLVFVLAREHKFVRDERAFRQVPLNKSVSDKLLTLAVVIAKKIATTSLKAIFKIIRQLRQLPAPANRGSVASLTLQSRS